MTLGLTDMKVLTNPKFTFAFEPPCAPCEDTADSAFSPVSGNSGKVMDCKACSVASAQAFKYSVTASNNYPEAPAVHLRDNNFVNGSEVPGNPTRVFRGDDATEVKVLFMPADYENRQTAKTFGAYRLVYAESALGSTQGFS